MAKNDAALALALGERWGMLEPEQQPAASSATRCRSGASEMPSGRGHVAKRRFS